MSTTATDMERVFIKLKPREGIGRSEILCFACIAAIRLTSRAFKAINELP